MSCGQAIKGDWDLEAQSDCVGVECIQADIGDGQSEEKSKLESD